MKPSLNIGFVHEVGAQSCVFSFERGIGLYIHSVCIYIYICNHYQPLSIHLSKQYFQHYQPLLTNNITISPVKLHSEPGDSAVGNCGTGFQRFMLRNAGEPAGVSIQVSP